MVVVRRAGLDGPAFCCLPTLVAAPMLRAGDPYVTAEEVVVDLLFVVGGALALVVLVLVIVGAWRG
jgi:hypothetical protein